LDNNNNNYNNTTTTTTTPKKQQQQLAYGLRSLDTTCVRAQAECTFASSKSQFFQ